MRRMVDESKLATIDYVDKSVTGLVAQSELEDAIEEVTKKINKVTLIWTNQNPTSNFYRQTLSLKGIADCDFLAIEFRKSTTAVNYDIEIIRNGAPTTLYTVNDNKINYRTIESIDLENENATITNGTIIGTYGSAGSDSSSVIVPTRIWGITLGE